MFELINITEKVLQLKQTLNFCSISSIDKVEPRYRDVYAEVPRRTLETHVRLSNFSFCKFSKACIMKKITEVDTRLLKHILQEFEEFSNVVWL